MVDHSGNRGSEAADVWSKMGASGIDKDGAHGTALKWTTLYSQNSTDLFSFPCPMSCMQGRQIFLSRMTFSPEPNLIRTNMLSRNKKVCHCIDVFIEIVLLTARELRFFGFVVRDSK